MLDGTRAQLPDAVNSIRALRTNSVKKCEKQYHEGFGNLIFDGRVPPENWVKLTKH
jgi:hypothetical protein